MSSSSYDIAVIGGGIIGLATARQLVLDYPRQRTIVLEKEPEVAAHQTGHNSGVIHAGIYYSPGSQKANFCSTGGSMLRAYCDERGIPYDMCGKVIVATDDAEIPRLEELHRRGTANGAEGPSGGWARAASGAGTARCRGPSHLLAQHGDYRLLGCLTRHTPATWCRAAESS